MTPEIVVLTHFPSPYQVELFDEIARRASGLKVYYIHRADPARSWQASQPQHDFDFLRSGAAAIQQALRDFAAARFAVIAFYNQSPAERIITTRAATGRPWSFWGERPGYRSRIIGRLVRKFLLRDLHRSRTPIWGIGRWAVDAYRQEFGNDRHYVDLPYFSDLSPFLNNSVHQWRDNLTFLYSGTFSHRKGVDLLCRAFVRLARDHPHVRLRLMGTGPMEAAMRRILEPVAQFVEWSGFKQWNELAAVYSSAHILVVPSRYDGWGLVVPEGLAAGLPVIGTDRTGAALEFVSQENGWMTRAGDGQSLFDAMARAAALMPTRWSEMSGAARACVAQHTIANGALRFLAAVDAAI